MLKTKPAKTLTLLRTLRFYKENKIWYADIPEFLELGLGDKGNLMMVDGADTFLDYLSRNGAEATIELSNMPFEGHDTVLTKETIGLNRELLQSVGHNPVEYGAYYQVGLCEGQSFNHRLWLCPVTEFVFYGTYPSTIYVKLISFKN